MGSMKILLAHMWMVIGGAETHVVELARGLKADGHDVTVASNGGVYVEALENAGVKHITVPLHTKNPIAMIKSRVILEKLIKKEKFDIVHAHSRIPAFICGSLAKKLPFKFVTSTHAVFKVNTLLSRISDWGEHTFAVSCDIKQYLIDNYKTPSDNITLTINGIDTEKFSKKEKPDTADSFRVMYVSRLEPDIALPAYLLCESAERLSREIPGLEICIVGGGTSQAEIAEKAKAANERIGRDVIKLTGPRTDIADIVGEGDVFVGVSRAALEAMSLELPVILAGQQGYLGILDEKTMPSARLTNYTCRGEHLPEAEDIYSDIINLYSRGKEGRASLGGLGREEILANYSVKKMVADHVTAYGKLREYRKKRGCDIIISGYYGFENIGDDSLLTSIIAGIHRRSEDARITVLAKQPRRLAKICGVKTINRFNLPRIALEMRKAKLLISGGGSLLQDGTSKKSLYYYVCIIKMAKMMKLDLMLYSNGLGPLRSEYGKKATADIISKADYISLREAESLELAKTLCGKEDMRLTADPAFLLTPAADEWLRHIMKREEIEGKFFVVSIKDGNNFDGNATGAAAVDIFAREISAAAEKYGMMPIFVPMYPSRDDFITELLLAKCGRGKIIRGLTASELLGLLKRAEFVIGTRLHMLIFAASAGVPMLGISYDPKINGFMNYIGEGERILDIRKPRAGELEAAIDSLIADSASMRGRLSAVSEKMKRLAEEDCDSVPLLLKSKS